MNLKTLDPALLEALEEERRALNARAEAEYEARVKRAREEEEEENARADLANGNL